MKNRLKELRQKNNLTLKQLGEKLNMRDSTLSQYETGKRSPKLKVWEKIADYFGVSTAYLLKIGEGPNKAHLMTIELMVPWLKLSIVERNGSFH